jgi:uncharacterized protein YndB with AHSA1/START domain
MKTEQELVVRVERHLNASAERVFDAFLNPEQAKHFMFVMGEPLVRSEVDPIVGGKYTFVDRRDGEDVAHTGEFLDITRPERLIFTLSVPKYSQDKDEVRIVIEPEDHGCSLTLTHETHGDDDVKRQVEQGWNGVLDRLEETIGEDNYS